MHTCISAFLFLIVSSFSSISCCKLAFSLQEHKKPRDKLVSGYDWLNEENSWVTRASRFLVEFF